MDVDSFIARHTPTWRRLDELSGRRRLDAAEADELVALYRQVATHLALVQSRAPDPALATRLSALLARGRAAAVGTPQVGGWAALARGVTVDIPVAVYRTWRWSAAAALGSLGVAAAMILWLRQHPERLRRLIPSSQLRQLVDHDFSNYYSAHPARAFGAQVWTNNSLVAAMCLFLGVTLIGTLVLLWANVVNLGVVGGAVIGAGHTSEFFGLILPHGLLELTAIFVAGGIGLRTGWAWVAPGSVPRAQSLGAAGRTAGVAALGLAGVLLVSGAIEAFVTPSGLPTWARIGIGGLAEAAFLAYVVVLGRRGVAAGATGDVPEGEQGDVLAAA